MSIALEKSGVNSDDTAGLEMSGLFVFIKEIKKPGEKEKTHKSNERCAYDKLGAYFCRKNGTWNKNCFDAQNDMEPGRAFEPVFVGKRIPTLAKRTGSPIADQARNIDKKEFEEYSEVPDKFS